MTKTYKNENGFVSFIFIWLILILLLVGYSYSAIHHQIILKGTYRKICLVEFKNIENMIVQYEKKLFSLNKFSTFLRLQITLTKTALAAATVSLNAPLVMQLTQQLNQLYQQQKMLDLTQKTLIQTANTKANLSLNLTRQKFQNQTRALNRTWSWLLTSTHQWEMTRVIALPVQPDPVGGLAPNYELKTNYQDLQKLELSWQIMNRYKKSTQSLLPFSYSQQVNCSLTAKERNQKWSVVLTKDKALWKP